MKKQYLVKICLGNNCYYNGSQQLFTLPQFLNESLQDVVTVEGMECCNECCNPGFGKPPVVEINGKIYSEMKLEKLLTELRSMQELDQ